MKTNTSSFIIAAILIMLLITTSILFIPNRTHATLIPVAGMGENDFTTAIKSTLNLISTHTSTAANVAQQINTYVLQPLAFIMSGHLMKMLTASVISFVVGATSGTGAPMFVQDLQGNLQRVGDIQANAFFTQFGRNSNSPFAGSITSSLRTNYLWNTSSAGFFAANRSTLALSSPNVNAFLDGDWSRGGGTRAWFALTTQSQNNPYTLYQSAQSHLASVVGGATAARLAELNWGQGFLSWCQTSAGPGLLEEGAEPAVGVNPGDPCYDKDGMAGTIMTPGSTIKATLDKVLGGTQDKLAQVGSLAKEVNQILGNIGTVFGTVSLASHILGGPGSGGLFGFGQTSAMNPTPRLVQHPNTPVLGVTPASIIQNTASISAVSSDVVERINQYESSWTTIRQSAVSAAASLNSLAAFCENAALNSVYGGTFPDIARAQTESARATIASQITPIINQANATVPIISAARVVLARIQGGYRGSPNPGAAYLADLQTLQNMPPTDADISSVMRDSQTYGGATAIPTGSLNVSGGTMRDRLILISANAEALKGSVCTEPTPQPGGGTE